MNNFDFSIYDSSEDAVPPMQPQSKPQKKQAVKTPKENTSFSFDQYDFTEDQAPKSQLSPEEESAKKDKIYQMYAPRELTKEQLKNMTVSERLEYARELNTAREYLQSAGFVKGALSGLTFGASENIEALKPQPHELNTGLGELAGSAAPISLALKAVSVPVKAAVKYGPKILQPLRHLMTAFGTGATYESGKQGVNALSGNEVDLKQIPIRGAEFATIDSVIRGAGALGKKFLQLSPAHQAEIIEQQIIPRDLPKSQYETAEEMLNLIRQQTRAPDNFPRPGGPIPSPGGSTPPGGGSSNARPAPLTQQRITPPQDIGLRPVPARQNPALQDQVGNIFSPNRFYNTTQGGHALRNEIMNIDEDVYRGVNELYRHSRELNSNINEIHPQLVTRLQNRVRELEAIPEPSDVQRRLLRASNNVLEHLAAFDEAGHPTGYLPINNQVLIDQIQSLRQIIDYDFAHGNTKNIFRPLINDLQDSALRAAETTGQPEAAEAINEARNAYRTWVQAFDNDYIRPFRDASNQDFSKLFKSSLDLDEANMIRNILGITPQGQQLANASTREIVEKHLSKYFENPRDVNPRDFDTTLRELEAVITPEQTQQIRDQFHEASRRPNIRARQQPPRPPTNDERIAARYENNQPEDIQKMMDSRSGIKQLREDFSNTVQKRQVFQRLTQQKMRSILREGNIEKEFTGDDLYRFLNKEKNYELFSEFLGETETEALRQSAKEIGKDQVKKEVRKKNITKAAHKVAAYKTLEIVLGLL